MDTSHFSRHRFSLQSKDPCSLLRQQKLNHHPPPLLNIHNMSYSLNSLKVGYIGDYIGDYYRAY